MEKKGMSNEKDKIVCKAVWKDHDGNCMDKRRMT
jgi:hypothetical protein